MDQNPDRAARSYYAMYTLNGAAPADTERALAAIANLLFMYAGQNIRSAIGVWQWQDQGARQVYPAKLATSEIKMVPLPPWSKR